MNYKPILFLALGIVVLVGLYAILSDGSLSRLTRSPQEKACTMEAKICPDGSLVGRTGANCEFAVCPEIIVPKEETPLPGTRVTVSTKLGQGVVALGETITPLELLEDSRCPADVQCVWAGTVRVKGTVLSEMGLGQLTFELGKESTTEVNSITLIKAEPTKVSTGSTKESDYVFTFEVVRR